LPAHDDRRLALLFFNGRRNGTVFNIVLPGAVFSGMVRRAG